MGSTIQVDEFHHQTSGIKIGLNTKLPENSPQMYAGQAKFDDIISCLAKKMLFCRNSIQRRYEVQPAKNADRTKAYTTARVLHVQDSLSLSVYTHVQAFMQSNSRIYFRH